MNPAPILPVTEIDHVETTKIAAASLRLGRDGWHRRTWDPYWHESAVVRARVRRANEHRYRPGRCTGGMICYGVPF